MTKTRFTNTFGFTPQGEDKGKGQSDGRYSFRSFFECPRDCGMFVPFSRIKPVHPKPSAPWVDMQENPIQTLSVGDRVTYILDDKSECQHGMVLSLLKDGTILISTVCCRRLFFDWSPHPVPGDLPP